MTTRYGSNFGGPRSPSPSFTNTPDHPAAKVECPACVAKVGQPCQTDSGLASFAPHKARVLKASRQTPR